MIYQADNGYYLWSFQGRLIRKHSVDRFCQLLWRPRPPTLLSPEKIKEIKKNLKKYSTEFDAKDKQMMSRVSKEILEKRKRMLSEFKDFRDRKAQEAKARRARLLQLRGVREERNREEYDEEIVEFLIKEEIVDVD